MSEFDDALTALRLAVEARRRGMASSAESAVVVAVELLVPVLRDDTVRRLRMVAVDELVGRSATD